MSGSHYLINKNTSLFSVEDDIDDDEFLRHPPSGNSGYMLNKSNGNTQSNLQDLHQQHLNKQREIQNRMVQSSQKSLSMLRDSEEMGVSTAEELLRQREQLERTEKRLDEINTTLRFSQKHIQGIKSAFGSLKNYFSGKTEPQINRSKVGIPTSSSSQILQEVIEGTKPNASSQTHPGLRVRGLVSEEREGHRNTDPEKQIDDNLSEMVNSITRLKGLAYGLGEEIDSQNDLVENIIDKTERADMTLQRQNKDMNRLLK